MYYEFIIFLKIILIFVLGYFILNIFIHIRYKLNEREKDAEVRENMRRKFKNFK